MSFSSLLSFIIMVNRVRCSNSYHKFSGVQLPAFASSVNASIKKHYKDLNPDPEHILPVTVEDMESSITELIRVYEQYRKGGKIEREMYMMARAEVLQLLDHIAEYINTISNGNPALIAKAGYKPVYIHTNSNSLSPLAPRKVKLSNAKESGSIMSECETYGLEHFYGCIVSETKPIKDIQTFFTSGLFKLPPMQVNTLYFEFNHNRKKTIKGLTKGNEYYFYYFVINHNGVSNFSEPVSIKCK